MSACSAVSESCPQLITVPFVSIDIPDSVEAGKTFTIDAKLYDWDCYENAEIMVHVYSLDTLRLTGLATGNTCNCPKESKVDAMQQIIIDTTKRNKTIYCDYYMKEPGVDTFLYHVDSIRVY